LKLQFSSIVSAIKLYRFFRKNYSWKKKHKSIKTIDIDVLSSKNFSLIKWLYKIYVYLSFETMYCYCTTVVISIDTYVLSSRTICQFEHITNVCNSTSPIETNANVKDRYASLDVWYYFYVFKLLVQYALRFYYGITLQLQTAVKVCCIQCGENDLYLFYC